MSKENVPHPELNSEGFYELGIEGTLMVFFFFSQMAANESLLPPPQHHTTPGQGFELSTGAVDEEPLLEIG